MLKIGLLRALIGAAAVAAVALPTMSAPAHAANFSFTGNFTADDNVQLFNFSVGSTSLVTLRTWSYAGGVNAQGATIARGGFDPILALFNSGGTFIGQNDDGGCGLVAADSATHDCWDTFFQSSLTAGNYSVAVMQFDNFAIGPALSNGFSRSGQGNFTHNFGCPANQPAFNDVSGTAGCGRDNHWAFDILNVGDAVVVPPTDHVPAPGALALLGVGLVGLFARRRWFA